MSQLFNLVLTLGVPALGLLIAYRLWSYAAKSSSKSPQQVVGSLISIVIVFVAGVLFIPRALNWGSNIFVSQMMANPGVQAGIGLASTGAGLVDSGLSGVLSQGAQTQVQIPQVNVPQVNLSGLLGTSAQAAPQSSLSQPFAQWSQSIAPAGSQVALPQFSVPNVAVQGAQAPAAPQNLVQQVQVQAQATAQAIVAEVQQNVQAQTDAQAIKEFSFDAFLATPEVPADCLTGATQGPQLPHCVGVDRQAEANNVWQQQQADIADYAKETAAQSLQSFSWGNTADAQATAEANIAHAATNATAQAVNVANQQAAAQAQANADAQAAAARNAHAVAQATANAQHQQQWVAAQVEATRQAYDASLRITQPSQAEVYQAAVNPTPVPAGCLTGAQQGPQLPHCMGVDRSAGESVWTLADSGE